MSNTITARRIGQFHPAAPSVAPQRPTPVPAALPAPRNPNVNWGPPPAGLEWADVATIPDRAEVHRRVFVTGMCTVLFGFSVLVALLMSVPGIGAQMPVGWFI